ncbi:MAG: accessory factor UbiK family protein [Gammaproteobacteria bacterium]|nr:accessory factor UbiK family protein [Pseudomonadales bacterium]
MVNRQILDQLSKTLSQLLPRAGELGEEGRNAVRQALQKGFAELNILTREDFEARDRALKRAEERVNELEQLVQELERLLKAPK